MAHLIEQNGEQMVVASLDGHEGAKVIKQGTSRPSEHHRWNGERWEKDQVLAERDRLNAMDNAQLVEEIMRRLAG